MIFEFANQWFLDFTCVYRAHWSKIVERKYKLSHRVWWKQVDPIRYFTVWSHIPWVNETKTQSLWRHLHLKLLSQYMLQFNTLDGAVKLFTYKRCLRFIPSLWRFKRLFSSSSAFHSSMRSAILQITFDLMMFEEKFNFSQQLGINVRIFPSFMREIGYTFRHLSNFC